MIIREKFHRCLKLILSKVTSVPSHCDKFLPAVLFAYSRTPRGVTEFSCHELIFDAPIRGPLSLMRDMWVRPDVPQYQTYNFYSTELRQHIMSGCQIARENLTIAGEQQHSVCNQ